MVVLQEEDAVVVASVGLPRVAFTFLLLVCDGQSSHRPQGCDSPPFIKGGVVSDERTVVFRGETLPLTASCQGTENNAPPPSLSKKTPRLLGQIFA